MIKTLNIYYKYRAFSKAFIFPGQHHDAALEPGRHQMHMLPSNQGDIKYVTLLIPLILGVKVLHLVRI